MTNTPETVLASGGTTARFDGQRSQVVRGRGTWLDAAISGDSGYARHGLGRVVELPGANSRSTKASLGQLTTALATRTPAADGHALMPAGVSAPSP
ncbi:hypothetical protein [Streptomyces sp. NPDC029674]|uniref:hypothetical protein n=1 Tax=Streptomyces sp. NPDC029674 TaxID=3365297 RepID=UPI00384AF79E